MHQLLYTFLNKSFYVGSREDTTQASDSKAHNPLDSDYYAKHGIPVMVHGREIGKVFAEVNDNLVIIAGENKKEHEYLIPKSKVSRYDDKQVYLSISDDSLKQYEV